MSAADPLRRWWFPANIKRWVDGDTVDVWIQLGDLGFGIHLDMVHRQRLRLARVNTPEIRPLATREAGEAAKQFAEGLARAGSCVLIETRKTGKFGRYIAEVWTTDDEGQPAVNISDALIEAGHGVPVDY